MYILPENDFLFIFYHKILKIIFFEGKKRGCANNIFREKILHCACLVIAIVFLLCYFDIHYCLFYLIILYYLICIILRFYTKNIFKKPETLILYARYFYLCLLKIHLESMVFCSFIYSGHITQLRQTKFPICIFFFKVTCKF